MSNMALLAASTLLLLLGLGAAFLGKRSKASALILGLLVLVFFLLGSAFVAANQFTGRGIDQAVLYHATYGLSGAGFSEYWLLMSGVTLLVLAGVALACASTWLLGRERERPHAMPTRWLSLPLALAACVLNPASKDLFVVFGAKAALARLGGSPNGRSPAFAAHYRAGELGAEPPVRKNLVFIYAEGLERTYFDESLFPGLVVGLRELEAISTSFTNIDQTEGTTFTIGGMVGSQCGIPLVTSSGANSMSGMGRFLPEAVCVGDLLSSRGYHMAYVGGASLRFAGKGEFLSAHGFADRQGREELQSLVNEAEYHSGWGLYDDSLLDIAYDKFVALSEQPKNFGLFLLTLDTHAPDGHLSRRVADARYADGDVAILNAVAGADRLLHAFVRRLMASPHAENTVIVICSDHLAMKNGASSRLDAGARKNLFLIIDPQKPTSNRVDKPGTTLDVGPTVLHALGYHAKLGLGRNLLGNEPTLREQVADLGGTISEWRRDLSSFWGLSELRSLKILPDSRTLEAGGTTLRIPTLILFDEELHSEVFFEFDNAKDLTEYVAELKQGDSFVWVAPCNRQNGFVPAFGGQLAGDCVIASKRGARPVIAERINSIGELSEADLRRVLASPAESAIYDEQGRGLLEAQLPHGVGEFLSSLPPGSTFFQTKSRAAQRLARYAKLPPLSAQNLVVTHTLPRGHEFYFSARDLDVVRASDELDVSRVTFGDDLVTILRRHEGDTVIIAAKDDARSRLSAAAIDYFSSLGIDLRALRFRGSFAAVIDGRRPIAAEVKNGEPVVLDSPALRGLGIDRVESAGYDCGNVSKIIVGGRELSNNTRGLNIVVLTRDGRRLSLTIDTAVSENLYLDLYKATPRR